MKKVLSIFLLLLSVAMGAWAADSLTKGLEVTGYKAVNLFDFQNKDYDGTALSSFDDLPGLGVTAQNTVGSAYGNNNWYDDTANNHGLRLQSGGGRWIQFTVSVKKDDYIIINGGAASGTYGITMTNGESVSVADASDYLCFKATQDAENLRLTVTRYNYLLQILIMTKDESAETADYTINYLLNGEGEPVKTITDNAAVGSTVNTDASFFANDAKYFRADGQPESFKIESSGNTFNVTVREAAIYNYSLSSNFGETLASGSGFEGETVSVGYPRYQLKDGVFYEAGVTNKEYRKSIALSEDNASATVEYAAKDGVNAVFYVEGESIEGMTEITSGNIPVRGSYAKAGVAEADVAITTLPAGKYVFHAGIFTSKSQYSEKVVNFGIGSDIFAAAFVGVNLNEVASAEFTLTEETAIKYVAEDSWADAQLDYLWIEKTGDYVPPTPVTYAVNIAEGIENGTVTAEPTEAEEGAEVTLTATPAEGYELESITVTGVKSDEAVVVTDNKFKMPADDVTVSATFSKIPVYYAVSIAEGIEGGTVTADPVSALEGAEVTLTATPAEGYDFVSFNVTCKVIDQAVVVTDGKFTMPADEVTVSATFQKKKNPIYIESDLTAQFPIDYEGWIGATGFVGWAAPEVTTNDGRKTAACESYKGTCADTGDVFTRTLTGLTNGTYRIELYGAAAFTSGRGFDSTLEDGATDCVNLYAETPAGQVKQYIPAYVADNFNGTGIATAVLDNVIVTDGTVKIGMYKDQAKTNWHVVQIKGVTALVDAVELHANTVAAAQTALSAEENAVIVGEEKTAFETAIENNSKVAEETADAYKTAIAALETATKTFTDAREPYAALVSTKESVAGYVEKYVYASAEKISAVNTAAEATPASAADATSKNESLTTALRAMAESHTKAEGVEGAAIVEIITNPSAEDGTNGWTVVNGEGSDGNIDVKSNEPWTSADGNAEHKYFDGGNWGASAWDVSLTQDVELEAGKYLLSAVGRASGDVALTLFAGENKAEMPAIGAAGGLFNRGWNYTSVEFVVDAKSTVTIGVQGVTDKQYNWMSFSDFKLILLEAAAPATYAVNIAEGIENGTVTADPTEAEEGAEVTLTATPAEGYELESITVTGVNGNEAVVVTDNKFKMPADDVMVSATFSKIPVYYAVSIAEGIEGGTVTADPVSALEGAEVTLTATPAEGYELVSITVTGVNGNEAVVVTGNKFKMPADEVTVSATFKKKPIYIETDLTADFDALTINTNWKNIDGGTAGYTATNFCPAVTTNAGKTVQVCEYYKASCDYTGEVLTQTVTGLTPGTYKIELYGGAAYTFGRGFDSEAFSEGTWNAGDKIEPSSEVSTGVTLYAETSNGTYGGELPIYYATNFPEGAAVVTIDGVQIGSNGQVKIGMTKTSKSTNWHVIQLKGVTAQVDAVELHANTVAAAQAALSAEENAVIVGEEKTALETAIEKNSEVAEETADAYKAAIEALQTATSTFTSAREAYAALASTIKAVEGYVANYVYASADKISAVNNTAAEATPASAADATSKNESLTTALRAMAESHTKAEGVEGAAIVEIITNPSAEDGTNGWTVVKGEGSGGNIDVKSNEPWTSADGNTAHKYFDGGNWGASAWDVSLTQNVELGAGKYLLSAIGRASGDVALTLFAGESKATMPAIGAAGGLFNRGWNYTSVEFVVDAKSTVTIGVQGKTDKQYNWMSFSDFKVVMIESYAVRDAKAELLEAINEAKAIDTEYKDGVEELNAAIADAEGVYNNEEATLENVEKAKSDLAAAVEAFTKANAKYSDLTYTITGQSSIKATIKKGKAVLDIIPQEGWAVTELTVDGADAMEQLADNKLIVNVEADATEVVVTFGWADAENMYEEDEVTGIATIADEGIKVYASGNQICVEGAAGKAVRVYSLYGSLISTATPSENKIAKFTVASGTYVVQVGKKAAKISVK